MKVAGELLYMNTAKGQKVDRIIIHAMLSNLKENVAKPYRITLDFKSGKYYVWKGTETLDFTICLIRLHTLLNDG